MKKHPLILFLSKTTIFAFLFYASLYALGFVVEHFCPWQDVQDPREKILWAPDYDGSKIVIIGDSVFCSYNVDRIEDTLWNQLERLTKLKVFPGALNGARPIDMYYEAKLISQKWPKSTVVFMDIIPTFYFMEKKDKRTNYEYLFNKIIYISEHKLDYIKYLVWNSLFIIRNQTGLTTYFYSLFSPPNYEKKDKIWKKANPELINKFNVTKQELLTYQITNFDILDKINAVFEEKGITLIYVIAPFNAEYVRSYTGNPDEANRVLKNMGKIHDQFAIHLKVNKIHYVDLFDTLPSDHFADIRHTNAKGDMFLADKLSKYLINNPSLINR